MNIAALATEQIRLAGFNVTYGPYSEERVEGILRKLWADALHEIICLLEARVIPQAVTRRRSYARILHCTGLVVF